MIKLTLTAALATAVAISAPAWATATPYADAVYSYTIGTDGGFGVEYLPGNIAGAPDYNFNEYNKEVLKSEIFSLGIGGSIVVEFTDNVVVNGDGVDLTVFENGFVNAQTGKTYCEGAEVYASADNVVWYDLGYAQGTRTGLINNAIYGDPSFNPLDPTVSGGDLFDIAHDKNDAATGLAYVKYVKIVDDGDGASAGSGTSGFDLDAVAAVHSAAVPEPATFILAASAACGIAGAWRARRGKHENN